MSENEQGRWAAREREAELRATTVALAGQVHALEAELARTLNEVHRASAWETSGFTSMAHWVQVNCGFTPSDASRRCAVATRLDDMPALGAAADEGRLSMSLWSVAARHIDVASDERLAEVCTLVAPAQAMKTLATFRRVRDDDPAADEPDRSTSAQRWHDDQQMYRLEARLDADDGALFDRALDAAKTELDRDLRDGDGDVDRDAFATNAEALVHLARVMLDRADDVGLRERGGDRFAVGVIVDARTLATGEHHEHGECRLEAGTALPISAVRRICCTARLQMFLERDGRPLAIGRETKEPSRAIRRALRRRDRGCVYPGCRQTRFVDAHHVVHWADGGPTDLDNLALLCTRHHRALHKGHFDIRMIDGRPEVVRPDRNPVRRPPDRCRHHRERPNPDPDAATCSSGGEPLTADALDALVAHLCGG
jgi:hypothetical protein